MTQTIWYLIGVETVNTETFNALKNSSIKTKEIGVDS